MLGLGGGAHAVACSWAGVAVAVLVVIISGVSIWLHCRKWENRSRLQGAIRPGTKPEVIEKHREPRELRDLFESFEEAYYRGLAFLIRMPEAELHSLGGEGCETLFKVSPYLCREDENGEKYLPCATIVALFDETSSQAQTFSDRHYRVGMSVTLDVEVLDVVRPDTVLRMKVRTLKQGKTLAFLEMNLYDEQAGKLVAVGKHIKYVQMDMALRWMSFMWKAFSVGLLPAFPKPVKDAKPENPTLYDYFPLNDVQHHEDTGITTSSFRVASHHYNFFQTCHGGASAIFMEEAALRHRAANSKTKRSGRIKAMKLSYLSPVRKRAEVRITTLADHTCRAELVRHDELTAVQCVLRWHDEEN